MRVALVYDRVNKIGGAERVLVALHEIYPKAPIFTSVYEKKLAPWSSGFAVIPSFLQHIPFLRRHHEYIPWATPFAFESFSFDAYDLVISVTSAEAKTIITKPQTLHICYCLTPTRYLWSGLTDYMQEPGFGILDRVGQTVFRWFLPVLRRWDSIAALRPDRFVAISNHVAGRITKYYGRSVDAVIYPPAEIGFRPKNKALLNRFSHTPDSYYLCVSRLVGYKRVDLVIEAANKLQAPLIVIGQGRLLEKLKKKAGPTVTFIGHYLTDEELLMYYQNCRAFVFAGQEDFGIVAVEALLCGKPVIAYKEGGLAEIVLDGKTGILFDRQDTESLTNALLFFEERKNVFAPDACLVQGKKFGKRIFQKQFRAYINKTYTEYKTLL